MTLRNSCNEYFEFCVLDGFAYFFAQYGNCQHETERAREQTIEIRSIMSPHLLPAPEKVISGFHDDDQTSPPSNSSLGLKSFLCFS